MRKLILLFFVAVSMVSYGQNNKIQDVTFYGIDFSMTKVYGADETPGQFIQAFHGINRLFLSEPKKYDVCKFLRVDIIGMDLDPVEKLNDKMDVSDLIQNGYGGYVLTDDQIEQEIKKLPIEKTTGTGLVFIAEVLNKASNRGHYKVVYFDLATRDVLEIIDARGVARGFGLRNYWAGSVYNMMKKL
ncbi:hypothetical protein [Bacteroides sp. 224]|uniref:hypothetical protein n=1 Tax=Bacteroides sp. 224 TaxID=2302936 RepID=UPI0013D7DB12|nr:hypothetical protein [Bacteroides sp. 224]NDV65504.1 hypothetical protein [Bacteroides sp. 224]